MMRGYFHQVQISGEYIQRRFDELQSQVDATQHSAVGSAVDFDHILWLVGTIVAGIVAVIVVWNIVSAFVGPIYRVWAAHKRGLADLAMAENETRIAVLRAEREAESARHYAEADVERAKGIAASIVEVEQHLGGPEGYLRWKYIHMLEEQDGVSQIIYLPTEAGLPILEANRLEKK